MRWMQYQIKLCAVILALLSVGLARSADKDKELLNRLLAQIEKIPMVDTHSHVPWPRRDAQQFKDPDFRYNVSWLLGSTTYVGEFLYGKDWSETKKMLEVNAHHAYYRPIRQALVDLYGLDSNDELSDDNVKGISERMDAKRRDPAWYGEVYRRANVQDVITLEEQSDIDISPGNELAHTRLYQMWNVDSEIVYVATPLSEKETKKSGIQHRIDETEKHFGVKLRGLADMEALIDREIAEFFQRGGVGLKSTSAYFRPLNFDTKVPRKDAESIFKEVIARKTPSEDRRRRLEDYLMTKVLQKLNQMKKPIQFHTGNQQNWNLVANSSPLELNKLLYDGQFSDVKFVILHGGYPYSEEAITMVRYFPNAYLDLSWMALFSPAAAKRALADAIDMLDGRHLMFGTDSANLEEMYGTVKFTRRLLTETLAEKVESGFLTEEVALRIARRILYTNAMDLYDLEKSSNGAVEPASSRQ
jgi:predicted TIM-barrel fold metal-dependent hydrolase